MNLVTAAQMREIDHVTIHQHGIPGLHLMENAGRGIAEELLDQIIENPSETPVAVFCGKGNNGGDGLVIARYLFEAGVPVTVYYLGPAEQLSQDARVNLDNALRGGVPLVEVTDTMRCPREMECRLVIDAVFGTGFSGAPRGLSADMIDCINLQEADVISVDLPSGLNADTGRHEGPVVQATYTYTLGLPKFGLYLSPGRELAGDVAVVDIGIPEAIIRAMDLPVELITHDEVAERMPYRKPDGHKGDFGRLFVLAGSVGLTGAAALSSYAAMRSGTGLVKLGTPTSAQPVLATKLTEITTSPLPEVRRRGVLALRSLGEIRKLIGEHDAVALGPGLGRHHETTELVRRVVNKLDKPTVVDADGLNAFDGAIEAMEGRESDAELVLTPHPGEFQRLTGFKVPDDILERTSLAIETAVRLRATLVLKGSPTVVADSKGRCYLNPTGNNGMATGGSGDVLTGMIGAFLAQGMRGVDAAFISVYLHGLAGDIAAETLTPRAMVAGDIIDCLPEAFMVVE